MLGSNPSAGRASIKGWGGVAMVTSLLLNSLWRNQSDKSQGFGDSVPKIIFCDGMLLYRSLMITYLYLFRVQIF